MVASGRLRNTVARTPGIPNATSYGAVGVPRLPNRQPRLTLRPNDYSLVARHDET